MRRYALLGCVAMASLTAVILIWPASSTAANGTYTLVQCDPLQRASNEAELDPSASYAVRPLCGDAEQDFALKIESVAGAQPDRKGRVYWQAPDGTSIVGVSAEVKLRNGSGSRARVFIADGKGREVRRLANGQSEATNWERIHWDAVDAGHERFTVTLSCETTEVCPQSDQAKAWVREVRIKLRDEEDPVLTRVEGSLFDGGWLTGDKTVDVEGVDEESGVGIVSVEVNGFRLAAAQPGCPGGANQTTLARNVHPCPATAFTNARPSTGQAPFADGTNLVLVCAQDFALNTVCSTRNVRVDNSPPNAAFSNEQIPDDPELLRVFASDATSGVETASIFFRQVGSATWIPLPTSIGDDGLASARVDSSGEAPGSYEFLAQIADAAGNESETLFRENGQPMTLEFPLKSGVQINGQLQPGGANRKVIGYGRTARVAGKLLTRTGEPLADRRVKLVEHFGSGALISRRTRTVRTDRRGRWEEVLPPGPSRRITASFAGDTRYLERTESVARLFVRSRAAFSTSRRSVPEGKKVKFSGRVGHLGAHIPPGGKLVELQVRERPGRWNTVREAFNTNASGQYRIGYRFGRFYVKDARFRFRVKVTREQGWPYKAPVRSKQRKVIVQAEH